MNRTPRRQRLVLVADPKRLRLLIQEAVKGRFNGNVSRAARAIGLSQSQLCRLADRGAEQLRVKTLRSLAHLFTEEEKRKLHRYLLSPMTRLVLSGYADWLGLRVRSTRDLLRVYRGYRPGDGEKWLAAPSADGGAKMRMVLAIRRRFKHLFDRFDRSLVAKGHFAHRVGLAYYRILEGLLQHEPSAGIERSWTDIPPSDLQAFIEAGIRRETILLARSPDLQCAQEIAIKEYPQKLRR